MTFDLVIHYNVDSNRHFLFLDFETMTVAFQGEVEHHDSQDNSGIIGPGDVQWMTAGRGIVHQEYHSKEFTKTGGTFEMCQLWVNLPKKQNDRTRLPRNSH
jgi:redox-sensitive bicupin YhaK (pirin superfamily)